MAVLGRAQGAVDDALVAMHMQQAMPCNLIVSICFNHKETRMILIYTVIDRITGRNKTRRARQVTEIPMFLKYVFVPHVFLEFCRQRGSILQIIMSIAVFKHNSQEKSFMENSTDNLQIITLIAVPKHMRRKSN